MLAIRQVFQMTSRTAERVRRVRSGCDRTRPRTSTSKSHSRDMFRLQALACLLAHSAFTFVARHASNLCGQAQPRLLGFEISASYAKWLMITRPRGRAAAPWETAEAAQIVRNQASSPGHGLTEDLSQCLVCCVVPAWFILSLLQILTSLSALHRYSIIF